jgi:hypothetical protein
MLTFTYRELDVGIVLTFLKSLTGGQPTICALKKKKKTPIHFLVNMDARNKPSIIQTVICLCKRNTHLGGGRGSILAGSLAGRAICFSLTIGSIEFISVLMCAGP